MSGITSVKLKLILSFLTLFILRVHGQDILSTIDNFVRNGHPRILLTNERLEYLKSRAHTDTVLNRYVNDVLFRADNLIGTRSVEYKLNGPRLLSVSRDVKNRALNLGLAYRWTRNEKYAEELLRIVTDACNFPDWNPSHFLDVAEMTFAVALTYDWLYQYLNVGSRQKLAECLIKHGLTPGINAYENDNTDYGWWKEVSHNWNQVCNGGLMAGALAIYETVPDTAKRIINHAVSSLPIAINEYNPDGAWMEGPGYWGYATRYTAYGLSSLHTALSGRTYGLTEIKGLSEAGYFPIYTTGPTGYYLNFADSHFKSTRKPMASMFWLASTYNNFDFSNDEHRLLNNYNADPEHVIWYVPPQKKSSELPLHKFFESEVQLLTLRTGWDTEACFIGIKAGYNQVNHGHLDLGNFEFDALGKRWAIDLGSDNYNLPGYWDNLPGGKRWEIYRLGSKSHNVITINDKNQHALAEAHFLEYNLNKDEPYGIIDLTSTFPDISESLHRGVKLMNQGTTILLQDEVVLKDTAAVTWGMTTEAEIQVNHQSAVLQIDDKQLEATILSPAHAVFIVESAEQEVPEKANIGIQRLIIYIPETTGETITVAFTPLDSKQKRKTKSVEVTKLSDW